MKTAIVANKSYIWSQQNAIKLNILSVFNKSFSAPKGDLGSLFYSCLFGGFVAWFLIYFQPFDLKHASYADRPMAIAFFGIISWSVFVVLLYVLPKMLPKIYNDKHWKVWHQILLLIVALLIISTLNGMYINYLMSLPFSWSNYVWIITRTFALGSIPICIIVLIDYNRKLKRYLNDAKEVGDLSAKEEVPLSEDSITIKDNSELLLFKTASILYLEADSNYVNIYEYLDNEVRKKVVRTSLSQTEKDNTLNYFTRCHRSYLVNLNKVENVKGNAQGLKLHLRHCDFVVPVSRNYIPSIKSYFDKSNVK